MDIYIYMICGSPYGPPGGGGGLQVTTHSPFQVSGSQPSSYWYLFTSFTILGTCLIATGTTQDQHFTAHFEGILKPMALQSGMFDSSKTMRLHRWESYLPPSGVPWPAPMVPITTTEEVPHLSKMHPKSPSQNIQNKHKPLKPASKSARNQGPAAGGEALKNSPHPLQGERGELNHVSESQNLKVQVDPAPCCRPLPTSSMRFPTLHSFSSLTK